MKNNKRFLPIGTVVLLKNGKKELMIISYRIKPNGEVYDKNGKVNIHDKTFDYGACLYPEGMIESDQIFAFNHEQIESISFLGYQTDIQKELSEFLNKEVEKEKKQIKEGK